MSMKYLLSIYGNDQLWASFSKEAFQEVIDGHAAFEQEVRKSGEFVSVHAPLGPEHAKTVRARNGVPVVSDGPHIEAKEYVGSFYILDCETPERAVELAARLPDASFGVVEVTPLMEASGEEM
jgi:hypothetical protein